MVIEVFLQHKDTPNEVKSVLMEGDVAPDLIEDAVVDNPGYRLWYYTILKWRLP